MIQFKETINNLVLKLRKHPLSSLTLIYVIWQFSLSSAILMTETVEQSRSLSNIARFTVGLGAALWIFRLGNSKKVKFKIVIIVAILVGYCAMLIEDMIVNSFADRTTGEERRGAAALLIFDNGYKNGLAVFTDLAPEIADSKLRSIIFLKVMSLIIWQDKELRKKIYTIVEKKLFKSLVLEKVITEIDALYDIYANAYNSSNYQQIRELKHINFYQYVNHLKKYLSRYEKCYDEMCRKSIQDEIEILYRKGKIPISLPLEAFCQMIPIDRYVNGRKISVGTRRSCAADERRIALVTEETMREKYIDKIKANAGDLLKWVTIEEIERLLSDSHVITPSEWRELPLIKKRVDKIIQEELARRLPQADVFGTGGSRAEEGRELCISIFLPPVALGFSLAVCFLHILTTICLVLSSKRDTVLVFLAGFTTFLLPAYLATSVPIVGFAGAYARWLIFWEVWLVNPLAILRPVILGLTNVL